MDCDPLCEPAPAPELNIPDSECTVDVRVMDTGTLLYLNPELFWQPKLDGFDGLHAPVYCFLVSHGDRHVVFDLGVRRDWENYAPRVVSVIRATTTITMGTDIASMLEGSSLGIRARDVEAVIWSHNHFDHTGDPATFPSTTELVVGPGVRATSWPGYPTNPQGTVLDADVQGRPVREIAFHGEQHLRIGGFDASDYFGDGSFYLLDAPGHAVGHICALARTTAHPASFVFMGADACHHAGVLRPTTYLPLPKNPPFRGVCPGELLAALTKTGRHDTTFFDVAEGPIFHDHGAAMETVRKIRELDASEDVFVVLAHDLSLRQRIPPFPERLNDWKARGLRPETRWVFLQDFEGAVKQHAADRAH
ncbi:beta-lactamase-like protein [Achaetomium macrosporum]|uniref:Beta-lactamase-like protein n=1 Tax=Achaetomium macrosporum TaxID=79813 RepID=A0AAN7C3D8_9PEZI|nr:beta-lactamase-like protein [Achaetomium macrosporum]